MQALPLSCVRTALQTVSLAWTPEITASAAPKAATHSFSTRGGAGQLAQSKHVDKLISTIKKNSFNNDVFMLTTIFLLCLKINLLTYFRGFFETLEGACEACDVSCSSCDGIKTQCLSCADGHYLEGGMCRLNCSLRSYPADDGTCRRCPPHCDVCSDDRTCFSELFTL